MKNVIQIAIALVFFHSVNGLTVSAQEPGDYFRITVVDEQTGRGVPLVELKTTNSIRYYTDNNGIIAFYEPGLMEQDVYFYIKSHGYEYPTDLLGYRGKKLKVTKGGSALIKIKRINIAERLYRITGQGLYHHSLLVGHQAPIHNPVLNSKIMGQDAGSAIPYRGKLYWFWGDTDRPSYPLGNFAAPGGTSEMPGVGGLDPAIGIDLTYFEKESGFCKKMFPSTEFPGPGPKWISCLMTIKDVDGKEHLVAKYQRMKNLSDPYECGLGIYNDEKQSFEKYVQFDLNATLHPVGHPFLVTQGGQEYYYFANLYPDNMFIRVKASLTQISDTKAYEAFTCLVPGSKYNKSSPKLDRDSDGRLIYAWKANTAPIGYAREKELITAGHIKPKESWFQLKDINSGAPVEAFSGTVYWNNFRKRWVMIVQQNVGEVWYAEGDTPVGPWVYAKKIVTHHNYTFYLPVHHPFFDQDDGRLIYFEGTYTNSFSGNPDKTPRYNYNQIMYRLDLNDNQLYLPAPVYSLLDTEGISAYMMRDAIDSLNLWKKIDEIPFFAIPPNRKIDGLIAVYPDMYKGKFRLMVKPSLSTDSSNNPLFYGLSALETKKEMLLGSWKCKVDDLLLRMDVFMTENKVNASFKEESLIVTKVDFSNDTIVLNVKDPSYEGNYIITASVLEGKMNGNAVVVGTEEPLHWEGERIDFFWKQSVSPDVVPLYEYRNEEGEFHYSTDSGLTVMKRSEKPICYIWRNPTTTLALDFEAKPLTVIK